MVMTAERRRFFVRRQTDPKSSNFFFYHEKHFQVEMELFDTSNKMLN